MRLTVLGNNGPFPSAGGACSGYLLTGGGSRVLIDCGNGVLGNLQKFLPLTGLDCIIVTHLHSDHVSDLMVLRYAVQIKNARGTMAKTLDVYAPPEPQAEFERLDIKNAFNLRPLNSGTVLDVGGLRFKFSEMTHPVKCLAVSAEEGTKRFVFSGDTSWNEDIIGFSKGAELLMLDAGLLSKDKTSDNVAHLTAEECGIVAREAGVERLLLTHFWPEYDPQELLAEAAKNFKNTEIAALLETFEI